MNISGTIKVSFVAVVFDDRVLIIIIEQLCADSFIMMFHNEHPT